MSTKDLIRERMKKRKQKAKHDEDAEEGLINPAMDVQEGIDEDSYDVAALSGGSSSEALEELREAQNLKQDLTKKRRQKQKELSEKLISPKDDLARELRTAKKRSKKKLEDTAAEAAEIEALETLGETAGQFTEDGTVPMSDEEDKDAVDGGMAEDLSLMDSTDRLQRLKKKKSLQREQTEEEEAVEEAVEARAASIEEEASSEGQRSSSRFSKMRSRIQKAKEQGETEAKAEDRVTQRERRLKDIKDHATLTRFDSEGMDPLETERLNEERAKKLKLRWKKMEESISEKGMYVPTQEEAYDFFTRIYEPELDDDEPKKKKVPTATLR